MDRILFIVPPNITFNAFANPAGNVKVASKGLRRLGTVVTDMPLGPLSLSAYVKKHTTAQTRLIDFNVVLNQLKDFEYKSFKELFEAALSRPEWVDFDPTIVCISALFSPAYDSVLDLAATCREVFPGSCILAGGFLPTNTYRQMFRECPSFDGLCYGEGEKALVRLVNAADKLAHLEADPTWITRKKVAEGRPYRFDFITDLDEIPFIDYDIADMRGYALNPTMAAYPAIGKTLQNYHVMTSRGCIFHCAFCAQHTVHGRDMRYYSLERVREDFTRLRDEYGVQTIIVEDDHFMGGKERPYEILGIMIELGLTAFFPNSLALFALTRPMLERLKKVGVDQLVLAVESGSKEVLNQIMHKPLKLDIIERVTRDCREIGIYTDCNIVLGLPGETERHFEETREFLKTTYANWFRINIATPIVGSEMLDICVANGYIQGGDPNKADYKKAIVQTKDFTAARVQEFAYELNLELNFVFNSDFRLGDYRTALMGFNNAISAKPDHAFAHFYAARCYERLGDLEKARSHEDAYRSAAATSFWEKHLARFTAAMDAARRPPAGEPQRLQAAR